MVSSVLYTHKKQLKSQSFYMVNFLIVFLSVPRWIYSLRLSYLFEGRNKITTFTMVNHGKCSDFISSLIYKLLYLSFFLVALLQIISSLYDMIEWRLRSEKMTSSRNYTRNVWENAWDMRETDIEWRYILSRYKMKITITFL